MHESRCALSIRGCRDADSRIRYRGLGKSISMSLSGSIKDSRVITLTPTVNMLHNFSLNLDVLHSRFSREKKKRLCTFLFSIAIFMILK